MAIQRTLEIDARLTQAGQDLMKVVAHTPFRSSEAALVLRRITPTLVAAAERVRALADDPATREIGAQLEILYASANTTVDKASDLALDNDRSYRQAAGEIVDLFRDLPAIDDRLATVLARGATRSAQPSASPSAIVTPSPTSTPSQASTATPATLSPNPGELFRDPGFETGLQAWMSRAAGGVPMPATSAGPPLEAQGTRSLRVDVPGTTSIAGASIGQESIAIKAGSRYLVTLAIRADAPRSAQLRVVGPAEETYGITMIDVGTATTVARLEFQSVLDQPTAAFWIDLGGPTAGTVWLDDASMTAVTP